MSDFKERMAQIMKEKGITQIALSKKTGIPKSAVSQYLSGSFKPKDARIAVIAGALGVSSAWLRGYGDTVDDLSPEEQRLLSIYRKDAQIKAAIDALICGENEANLVFRAAKSRGSIILPGYEAMSAKKLKKLTSAPETDEDI